MYVLLTPLSNGHRMGEGIVLLYCTFNLITVFTNNVEKILYFVHHLKDDFIYHNVSYLVNYTINILLVYFFSFWHLSFSEIIPTRMS